MYVSCSDLQQPSHTASVLPSISSLSPQWLMWNLFCILTCIYSWMAGTNIRCSCGDARAWQRQLHDPVPRGVELSQQGPKLDVFLQAVQKRQVHQQLMTVGPIQCQYAVPLTGSQFWISTLVYCSKQVLMNNAMSV